MTDQIPLWAYLLAALATGGVLTEMWRSIFRPRKAKIDETAILTRLSAAFREEIRQENNDLRQRMDKVILSVTGLTDLLDDLYPKISGLTTEELLALRTHINQTKRAT